MILRVTNAIKNGEMVLPTIGYAVKAGVKLTISDEKYYSNDIQAALRRGLIEVVDNQGHENSAFAKKILIRNISGKPLGLDNISLLVNEESYISESEYNSTNLQTAINSGMIEAEVPITKEEAEQIRRDEEEASRPRILPREKKIVGKPALRQKKKPLPAKKGKKTAANNTSPKTALTKTARPESTIERLKRIAAEVDPEDAEFVDQEEEDLIMQAEEAQKIRDNIAYEKNHSSKTKMQAWNPHEKRMMDKSEASGKVCKIVSSQVVKKRTINDSGVMVGDVDFTDAGIKTAKKVVSAKGQKAKSGIKPVGRVRSDSGDSDDGDSMILDTSEDSDISFVDREQKIERMLSRPDLIRRKTVRQNQEIE